MPAALPKLPLGRGVKILAAHPRGLYALEKPPGTRSHPNGPDPDPKALLTCAYDERAECYHWSEGARPARLYLLHRLDAPTSGLILAAGDPELAERVKALFQARQVRKTYHAIVHGPVKGLRSPWRDQFHVTRGAENVRTCCGGGGEPAITEVRLLETLTAPIHLDLLELSPRTGRTHQLRVQCAERGWPIVGDATYGDFRLNRHLAKLTGCKRLFLHATRVSLSLADRPGRDDFQAESPLPPEFRDLLRLRPAPAG